MKIRPKNNCPINGFQPCKELECGWFVHVRGVNPNTGEDCDEYGCAMAWIPVMLIENSQQQRQTGAAVESFRNEMVKANGINAEMFMHIATRQEGSNVLTIKQDNG